ncbi:LysR family transcriptional regulator [Pseudomonas sp. TUM22785]|uniref:LysR family transcriptional regulator n=1 Tax=Pseudomonas sp. TUM22785 TaxID=3019098 RepID=UPI0023052652|nr:LysR family transcriptional regulator [Pseudomonas sp. TUM22785]WCD77886.1 LysR family transcriptional regulator [Pseudomonas sp. TUM22785]
MAFDEQLLRKFDLNALVTFMVVYRERSVSRAACKLNVTQPAVSNSLRKLRSRFGDPLFIPHCRYIQPTPLATRIAETLEPVLFGLQGVLAAAQCTIEGRGQAREALHVSG